MNNCIYIRKRKNKPFCKHCNKEITFDKCKNCKHKEYKEKKKYKIKNRVSKQSKALDISQKVKKIVFERDKGCCVVCGNNYNVMPNAHYISRAKGGLGIEQNIVTLCTNFTKNKCHYKYDFGTKEEREKIKKIIKAYLKSQYHNWNEDDLIYKK